MSISVECAHIPLRAPNYGGRILSVETAPGSLSIGPGLLWDSHLAWGGPGPERSLGFAGVNVQLPVKSLYPVFFSGLKIRKSVLFVGGTKIFIGHRIF